MQTNQLPEMDKGFILLQAIDQDGDVSQRELSSRTGLSLGSVNLLLQKMIHEGLIKMKSIPTNRVVYMLTPRGMAEKAHKTVHYIQRHYQMIESTKQMIVTQLYAYHERYAIIYLCLPGNELDDLIEQAVSEYRSEHPNLQLHLVVDVKEMQSEQLDSIVLTIPTDANVVQQTAGRHSIPQASLFDKPE
ncbi:MAG: winged helix-turn-helix transcriptional regulator [Clostridiaceae bacterium]|nr:winged helix-turn-helix transcriptional regulator [Clostridiales bacterium]NLV48845.1 winged helix-turn-helix transcriptional regulator [Clostridiaceae bacterium]